MFFEEPELREGLARGAPSALGEIEAASFESGLVVDNINARSVATERAYDTRSDEIFKATGVRLDNPMRIQNNNSILHGGDGQKKEFDREVDAYQTRLHDLTEQFPDAGDVIGADRPIFEDAQGIAQKAEHHLQDLMSRRTGLGKWLATLSGGLRAAAYDPVTYLTLPIGVSGRVGLGAKQILWMGIKQGAANAGVETVLQPVVQKWRADAGLDYGFEHAALNIGAAALFGLGVDAGGRALFRGAKRASGEVPRLDADGRVDGYDAPGTQKVDPAVALDELARNAPKNSLIRKAADGDALALKRLAKQAGIRDQPEIQAALRVIDMEEEFGNGMPQGVKGGNLDEVSGAIAQAIRSGMDPGGLALPPRSIELRPKLKPNEITPEIRAARETLQDGRLNVVEAADLMRRLPDAVDAGFELKTPQMRAARDLYYLSDDAFARVQGGQVPPQYAAIVGRHIDDEAMHGRAMDHMMAGEPRSRREAEFMLSDFLDGQAPQTRHFSILGARQIADDASDEVKASHGPLRNLDGDEPGARNVPEDVFEPEINSVVVMQELELADRLVKVRNIIEVCA